MEGPWLRLSERKGMWGSCAGQKLLDLVGLEEAFLLEEPVRTEALELGFQLNVGLLSLVSVSHNHNIENFRSNP